MKSRRPLFRMPLCLELHTKLSLLVLDYPTVAMAEKAISDRGSTASLPLQSSPEVENDSNAPTLTQAAGQIARVRNAIQQIEDGTQKKFGGPSFWNACVLNFRNPSFLQDIIRRKDNELIPEIAHSSELHELQAAEGHGIDVFITALCLSPPDAWYQYPFYWIIALFRLYLVWYLRLQHRLSKNQVLSWRQTAADIEARKSTLTWYFRYSPFNFLAHSDQHPWSSLSITLALASWVFLMAWRIEVAWSLGDRAYVLTAVVFQSRSPGAVLSFLQRRNLSLMVVLRNVTKRGFTLLATFVVYGAVAHSSYRYLYHDPHFTQINLFISLVWNNATFFYSEIFYLGARLAVALCRGWLAPTQKTIDGLRHQSKKLLEVNELFQKLTDASEANLSLISRDEVDCVKQIAGRTVALVEDYITPGMFSKAFSLDFWRETWRRFMDFLIDITLEVTKVTVLVITILFFLGHLLPFLNLPLMVFAKVCWGVQVITKVLQGMRRRRSEYHLYDLAGYMIFPTLYQIIGISVPVVVRRSVLDTNWVFYPDMAIQVILTFFLSDLPGHIMQWVCTTLGLAYLRWLLARLEKKAIVLDADGRHSNREIQT